MSGRQPSQFDLTQPVLVSDLAKERVMREGAPDLPSRRRTPEQRWEMSDAQLLEAAVQEPEFGEMVDDLEQVLIPGGPGRPVTTTAFAVALLKLVTNFYQSERRAVRECSDPWLWHRLRRAYMRGRDGQMTRRLGRRAPSRDAHRRAVERFEQLGVDLTWLDIFASQGSAAADEILTVSSHPLASPGPRNVVYGDSTLIPARTDQGPDDVVVFPDGTFHKPVYDPSGKPHGRARGAGAAADGRSGMFVRYLIILQRDFYGNHRLIRHIAPIPEGTTDAEAFTQWVEVHAESENLTLAVFDMAARGTHLQRMVAAGVVPMVKVPLRRARLDTWNAGPHTLRLVDATTETHSLVTVDGHFGFELDHLGQRYWVPLTRRQVRRRPGTMYVDLEVPQHPLVPTHLRGATTRARLNSTTVELEHGSNRSEHVRAFPEQDPLFDKWFGIREDAESTNNLLKSNLWGGRLRTANPSRNRLDLCLWGFLQNVKARLAYRQRMASSPRAGPDRVA